MYLKISYLFFRLHLGGGGVHVDIYILTQFETIVGIHRTTEAARANCFRNEIRFNLKCMSCVHQRNRI